MVCIACLLPLFLVPIVNLLPLLFDIIMARVYKLLGWEYRKPERAPEACPYKPVPNKTSENLADKSDPRFTNLRQFKVAGEYIHVAADNIHTALAEDNGKLD